MIQLNINRLLGVAVGLLLSIASSAAHYRGGPYETFSQAIKSPSGTAHTSLGLHKRGQFGLSEVSDDDASILSQAVNDMVAVVSLAANANNPGITQRYFGDQVVLSDIQAVFATVRDMAADGGITRKTEFENSLGPYDLDEIQILRDGNINGNWGTLAEAKGPHLSDSVRNITVYNFGWEGLWQRLRSGLQCDRDIGPQPNYKMHFLGTLLLHETLHFNNVPRLAWKRDIGPEEVLDDQPGEYPCFGLAYGPYEALKLAERDAGLAKLNIENYVWYALETYWLQECPDRAPESMFIAPQNNDIPNACKQSVQAVLGGAASRLQNLWCWRS